MVYALLFVSAFLFFILDRRIRFAVIPGMVVSAGAWSCIIQNYFYTTTSLSVAFIGSYVDASKIRRFSLLARIDGIIFYSAVTIMILAIFGKFIGRLIFDSAGDAQKAMKKAKTLFVIASAIAGGASVLYFVIDALKNKGGRNSPLVKLSIFYGVSRVPPIANREKIFIVVYILLIILSIVCIVLINTKYASYRTIAPAVPENGAEAKKPAQKNALTIIGLCFAFVGNIGFWIVDAVKKKAAFEKVYTLLFMKNVYHVIILTGLILLAIGLNKLISGKGKLPAVIPAISAVAAIVSFIASIMCSIDTLNFLTAAMHGSDIVTAFLGLNFARTGQTTIVNILTFLLVVLSAGAVFLIIRLVRATSRKED